MVTWYDKDGSKSYSTKERLTIWAIEFIVIVVAAIISVDLLKIAVQDAWRWLGSW